MRELQKKQIQKILVLLRDLSRVLHDKKGHIETLVELLQECQEVAIAVGNSIEKSEGQNHAVTSLLEEYCEKLYQCSKELSEENISSLEIFNTFEKPSKELSNASGLKHFKSPNK